MVEERYSKMVDIPDSKNVGTDLSMEEYLEMVEKVVQEQEAAG